jgi:hypothetical protein
MFMALPILSLAWTGETSTALQADSNGINPTPPFSQRFATCFWSISSFRMVGVRRSMAVRISMVAHRAR